MTEYHVSTDFFLRCESCAEPPGRLVARYQWMESQGVWVPVPVRGIRNVTITSLRGNEVDDWWFLAGGEAEPPNAVPLHPPDRPSDKPALREHHEIRCSTKRCGNKVAADYRRLEFILMMIERSVANAIKPGQPEWVYLLAQLPAAKAERGTTLTLRSLRAALALNNAKFNY